MDSEVKKTKWAVLIGIDYYSPGDIVRPTTQHGVMKHTPLTGCVNDVLAVEQYLLTTMKLDVEHITKLLALNPDGEPPCLQIRGTVLEPTYDNIIHALREVPNYAKKGDLVYLHYSGHGAIATSVFPELKSKGENDEVLVPTDINKRGKYLRDLELGVLLQKISDAGIELSVVLDCCHSGGAVRGDSLGAARGIPSIYASNMEMDMPANEEEIRQQADMVVWMQQPNGFVLLAACLPHQVARETKTAGLSYGLLTSCLLEELRKSSTPLQSWSLYERICFRVLDQNPEQIPTLLGDNTRFFFGSSSGGVIHGLSVRMTDMNEERAQRDNFVGLSGGSVHGVQEGSEYAILPIGTNLSGTIEETDIIGRVIVDEIGPLESEAYFVKLDRARWDEIKVGCPAVLRSLPVEAKTRVKLIAKDDSLVRNFKLDWQKYRGDQTWLLLVDDTSPAFIINVDEDLIYRILDHQQRVIPNFSPPLPPLAVSNPASGMPQLIRRLEHLARWNLVRRLENPDKTSALHGRISLRWEYWPEGQGSRRHGPRAKSIEWKDGAWEVEKEAWFRLVIENRSTKNISFVILNFTPGFGIKRHYPKGEPYYPLEAGKSHEVKTILDFPRSSSSREERKVEILDVFKLVASSPARGFGPLELPKMETTALRGQETEPSNKNELEVLLEQMAPQFREGYTIPEKVGDWETVEIKLRAV